MGCILACRVIFWEQIALSDQYIYKQGAYNKFPDIFVWAFKIDVDSGKFSMLLLYILRDD